jgi:death on curing protein
MEPVFLSLDEVLEIHEQQIERYGGSPGLRDGGALESAVTTPQVTFGGEFLHTSIPAMAAAYLFHLCQNHAFIDGNKRVGANAAITFLLMNIWEPTFDAEELTDWFYPSPQAAFKSLKWSPSLRPVVGHKASNYYFWAGSSADVPADTVWPSAILIDRALA